MAGLTQVMDQVSKHAGRISRGEHETVKPGMPFRFSEACQSGDAVWQGDLCLTLVYAVPDGYVKAKNPSKQLVPGTTQGSRHCLDSLSGVTVYLPRDWGQSETDLRGPCIVLTTERTVEHPTHGAVTIPASARHPVTVLCEYQRVWDAEQRAARRAQD